jgi:CheY-like chemotaxis protein
LDLPASYAVGLKNRALNIVLVEDDDVDVLMVKRALHHAKITSPLHVARDGIEALELLRNPESPSARRIVLLDLNMPRMGGLELLREIRRDEALRGLAVIVMTTSAAERDRKEAFQLGVAGFIVKPRTFDGFADAMSTLNSYWGLMEL